MRRDPVETGNDMPVLTDLLVRLDSSREREDDQPPPPELAHLQFSDWYAEFLQYETLVPNEP